MSKFCANCGAQLEDNASFCGACGAKQEAAQTSVQQAAPVQQAPVQQEPSQFAYDPLKAVDTVGSDGSIAPSNPMSPEQKKKIIIISAVVAAVIILAVVGVVIYTQLTKWQKIDPADLYHVSYSGINGQAEAEIYLATADNLERYAYDEYQSEYYDSKYYEDRDYESFINTKASKWLSTDKKDMKKAWTKADGNSDMKKMQEAIIDNVEFVVDEEDLKNLSNGDEIKVKVKYKESKLEKRNIKLTSDSFTIKVEGLVEPIVIDPFDGYEVTFTGNDGFGEAERSDTNLNENAKDKFSYYFTTAHYDLKNGDVVTIEADPWYSIKNGYFMYDGKYYTYDETKLTKDFTVSGLKELTVIDPFEGLEITYTGVCPNLRAEINKDGCAEAVKEYVSFDYDYSDVRDLDVGSTFTITASAYWYSEELADAGFRLESEKVTKTFTVPAEVNKYINDISSAKSCDFDTLMKPVYDSINGEVGDRWLSGLTLDGTIAKVDKITLDTTFLVAPAEIATQDNVLYQTGRAELTLVVNGANVKKTIAFVAIFDSAYIDSTGALHSDDTWINVSYSESMQSIIDTYVKKADNLVAGKLITSVKSSDMGKTGTTDNSSVTDSSATDSSATDSSSSLAA